MLQPLLLPQLGFSSVSNPIPTHDEKLNGVIVSLQLNPDVNVFQRKFVNEVRRCEEMDRKLSKMLFIAVIYLKGIEEASD